MNKKIKSHIDWFKIICLGLSFIFLIQIIFKINIVPIGQILRLLGIGNGILDVTLALFYFVFIMFIVGVILSILNKYNIVKGITKNTIILTMLAKAVTLFITLLPASLTFAILSSSGFFGETVRLAVETGKGTVDLEIIFSNIYLFWFFLITPYFKPEIAPEWGITKEEKDGLV